MSAAGLRPEDFGDTRFALWPENEDAINLFCSISTQWRVGMAGPTSLDYNVLFTLMGLKNLSYEKHCELFNDIRVIESEALKAMNTKD